MNVRTTVSEYNYILQIRPDGMKLSTLVIFKRYLLASWSEADRKLNRFYAAYLSSVLSAREMAGFLTALLHAWLLLREQTLHDFSGLSERGKPVSEYIAGETTCTCMINTSSCFSCSSCWNRPALQLYATWRCLAAAYVNNNKAALKPNWGWHQQQQSWLEGAFVTPRSQWRGLLITGGALPIVSPQQPFVCLCLSEVMKNRGVVLCIQLQCAPSIITFVYDHVTKVASLHTLVIFNWPHHQMMDWIYD